MPRSEQGGVRVQGYALKFELFRVFLPRPDSSYRGHGKPYTRGCKGSRLVVVEGGPHGVTLTHADEVNPELVDFLGQQHSRPSRPDLKLACPAVTCGGTSLPQRSHRAPPCAEAERAAGGHQELFFFIMLNALAQAAQARACERFGK